MRAVLRLFCRDTVETKVLVQPGTEAQSRMGQVASIADRGNLPCMWWVDTQERLIVGADNMNPPIPHCEDCPIDGGPIVKAGQAVPSRATCEYFLMRRYYQKRPADDDNPRGFVEWCWGNNVDPQGYGEATWVFSIPHLVRKAVQSVHLEVGDNLTSNGRFHSSRRHDVTEVYVNGRMCAHFVLDSPTGYGEYILRDHTHQPLDR